MADTCPWDAFPRADYSGCEPDLCAWIVHPAETWSNVAAIAVACVLVARYRALDRDLQVRWFPFVILGIGIASAAFHASMVHWFQALDLTAISLFTGFLLAANLCHAGLIKHDRFAGWFFLFAAGGGALGTVDARLGYFALALQGASILWSYSRIPARGLRSDLVAAIALTQVGAAALWLDHAGIACTQGPLAHVVQPHSFWHLMSALSLVFFYRYQRDVERILRGRLTWAEDAGRGLLPGGRRPRRESW
jgi:hypothetical protein